MEQGETASPPADAEKERGGEEDDFGYGLFPDRNKKPQSFLVRSFFTFHNRCQLMLRMTLETSKRFSLRQWAQARPWRPGGDPQIEPGTSVCRAGIVCSPASKPGPTRARQRDVQPRGHTDLVLLHSCCRRFPHVSFQDGAGTPFCWALTDDFGAGAHGYTLPARRRGGHMRAALALAARRSHARGFPVYGHTATGNVAMQRLQEGLGHQRVPALCRFVLHNPRLA